MHGKNLGGLRNNAEEVLPLYDKACVAHIANSCELAQAYRDEQAKRGGNAADKCGVQRREDFDTSSSRSTRSRAPRGKLVMAQFSQFSFDTGSRF